MRLPRGGEEAAAVVLPYHRLRGELLDDFDKLESWPERVITMQRNWIGRSEGAEVVFVVASDQRRAAAAAAEDPVAGREITVFTTRPDTLFGATFFILAPEHPLVEDLVRGTDREDEVKRYVCLLYTSDAADDLTRVD